MKKRELLKNSYLSFFSSLLSSVAGFLITLLLGKFHSVDAVGEYSYILNLTNTSSVIFGSSVGVYLINLISKNKEINYLLYKKLKKVFKIVFFTLFIFTIIYYFILGANQGILFPNNFSNLYFSFLPIFIFLSIFETLLLSVISGLRMFNLLVSHGRNKLLLLIFALPLIVFIGPLAAVFAFYGTLFLQLLLLYYSLSKVTIVENVDYVDVSSINSIVPSFLGSLLGLPLFTIFFNFILDRNNGVYLVGLYSIGLQLRTIISFLPKKIADVYAPMQMSNTNLNKSKLIENLNFINHISVIFGYFFVSILLIFLPSLLHVLNVTETSESEIMLSLFSFSYLLSLKGAGFSSLIQIKEDFWFGLFTNGIYALIFIIVVVNYFDSPFVFPIALIFANLINLLITFFFYRSYLLLNDLFKSIILLLIFASVILCLNGVDDIMKRCFIVLFFLILPLVFSYKQRIVEILVLVKGK
jgi:O-antigen/teichoic acid export membrane protein